LFNSAGNPWTADYLKISGELDVDLRNNIAAEARAKITYERLMHLTEDMGTKEALQFLMTREITHMKAFTAALDSLGSGRFSIGKLPPTPGVVDEYYNDSTGEGPLGSDGVGEWISQDGLRVADTPEFIKAISDSIKKGEDLARKSTRYSPDPEQLPKATVKTQKKRTS
jgi:Mn-containing catalase